MVLFFGEPIEDYLSQIKALSKIFFPQSALKVIYIRLNRISARIEIKKNLFIDLYYNVENDRRDYSLVKDEKRVLGWDNLGGWHHHPPGNPDKHIKCKEPKIDNVFQKMKAAIEETVE